MFDFSFSAFQNLTFFYVSNDEIIEKANFLEERFSKAETIKGTSRFNKLVPLNKTQIQAAPIYLMKRNVNF